MGKYQVHQSDTNEKRLIAYLRARGAQVEKIHQPVDLLVCFGGVTAVAEVKTSKGKANRAQEAFMWHWKGICQVLRNERDCDAFLKLMVDEKLGDHP